MNNYTERVERNLEGFEAVSMGGCPGCDTCEIPKDADNYDGPEPYFSWSACEGCGSTLGGDRYPAHALADGRLVHLDMCADCLFYIANGEEPGS